MLNGCDARQLEQDRGPVRPVVPIHLFDHDAIEIIVIRLDAEVDDVRSAAALLSDTERQRVGRIISDRDRRRFVMARAGLRRLLAERLHTQPEAVEFVYGAHGKPALDDHSADSDLHFNVSHAEDIAAYAFCRGGEIGIDIEFVRPLCDADDIATHFFSRWESEAYLALPFSDRLAGFFNCWTRKEAFVKALGNGLDYPLDRFDVSLAPGEPPEILRIERKSGEACGWTLNAFVPGPGLIGAVVAQQPYAS